MEEKNLHNTSVVEFMLCAEGEWGCSRPKPSAMIHRNWKCALEVKMCGAFLVGSSPSRKHQRQHYTAPYCVLVQKEKPSY